MQQWRPAWKSRQYIPGSSNNFLTTLRSGGGDSHYLRVDKPLLGIDADGQRGPRPTNFSRLENFGSPDGHWVRGIVNPSDPALFKLTPEMVQ